MAKDELEKKLEKKAEKWSKSCCGDKKNWKSSNNGGGEAIYGIGLIGALFYFLGNATSFGTVIMGILKAIVWPALMVYHLFGFLKI